MTEFANPEAADLLPEHLEEACDAFEPAWQGADKPRIEDYLQRATESERPKMLRELLKLDLYYRVKAGEHATQEEYC
jgi:eukaryotic-like serine/threonine-protein kinase